MELLNLLKNYKLSKRSGLFTTPSHSGRGYGLFSKLIGQKPFLYDFSEIDGFDNIRNPQGALLIAQKEAAEVYQARDSFFLYNGSTSGILALMLSSLKPNDKVIIPTNCHISVLNGLVLSKAEGVFVEPEYDEDFDVPMPLKLDEIKKVFAENPDAKMLILTNPTYEGMVAEISHIADFCNENKIILIVDEAHGALWNFSSKLPNSAILEGADAVVQSLHKTAGALTQSSILHLSSKSRLSTNDIQKALNLINSTSPSYLLLASIDNVVSFLSSDKGMKELDDILLKIIKFREKISKFESIKLLQNGDFTKIFLKVEGLLAEELSDKLAAFGIEDEKITSKGVLLLMGLGTTDKKLKKLEKALNKINKLAKKNCFEDN